MHDSQNYPVATADKQQGGKLRPGRADHRGRCAVWGMSSGRLDADIVGSNLA
jgi:hypothetical protein